MYIYLNLRNSLKNVANVNKEHTPNSYCKPHSITHIFINLRISPYLPHLRFNILDIII